MLRPSQLMHTDAKQTNNGDGGEESEPLAYRLQTQRATRQHAVVLDNFPVAVEAKFTHVVDKLAVE